jgi:hypothetical protein
MSPAPVQDTARPSRAWDGAPESAGDTRFFDLRESGYTGPIDQDGYRVDDLDGADFEAEKAPAPADCRYAWTGGHLPYACATHQVSARDSETLRDLCAAEKWSRRRR